MNAGVGWRTVPKLGILGLCLAAAAVLVSCGGDDAGPPPSVPGAVSVLAGTTDPRDAAITVLEYLPESVTVMVGSTVEWRFPGPEPHSVTFLPEGQAPPAPGSAPAPATAPFDGSTLVTSGVVAGGGASEPFEVSFAKAGTYTYVCLVHPLMTGTVEVVDADGEADTQPDVDGRADQELARWLEEGRAAKRALALSSPRSERAGDGTTTWRIEMGVTTDHTDVRAFVPSAAEIRPGDRVVFVNDTATPHTATFAGGGRVPLDPSSPEAVTPAPGPSPQPLNATDFFNTGVLPPNAPPGSAPPEAARSFTFVLPAPGTYSYVCVLHAARGMSGTIKVA